MYKKILLALPLFLSCCSYNKQKTPSILVIAVESLGFNKIVCQKKENLSKQSGFKALCNEAVRFTHAYTPSTLSQSAIAAVLTAKNPHENRLWDNGSSYISSEIKTISEWALEKNYKTSFFSGGAPILNKSGLSQGFERFNDKIKISTNLFHRPVQKNFDLFMNWSQQNKSKFFSFIYLNDLLFPQTETKNNQGQVRSLGYKSQLEEIDESLFSLIQKMKKRGLWDSTTVVFMGLNDQPQNSRDKILGPINLFSEKTHVSLFIKPSQKKRDLPVNWTINKNVSLTDVGATLYDLLNAPLKSPPTRLLEISSLKSVLSSPQVTWNEDRLILTESAWAKWRNLSNSHFALRKGHFLIINNDPLEIFNSLIDKNENTKINKSEPLSKELAQVARSYFNEKGFSNNFPLNKDQLQKVYLGQKTWPSPKKINKKDYYLLQSTIKEMPWDNQLIGWLAEISLQKKYWKTLESLGKQHRKKMWIHVAKRNQGEVSKINDQGCFQLFNFTYQSFKKPSIRQCPDDLLIKAVDWTLEQDKAKKRKKYYKFLRQYKFSKSQQNIAAYNHHLGLIFDTDLSQPNEPLLTDLFLSLPKNKVFLGKLDRIFNK